MDMVNAVILNAELESNCLWVGTGDYLGINLNFNPRCWNFAWKDLNWIDGMVRVKQGIWLEEGPQRLALRTEEAKER